MCRLMSAARRCRRPLRRFRRGCAYAVRAAAYRYAAGFYVQPISRAVRNREFASAVEVSSARSNFPARLRFFHRCS